MFHILYNRDNRIQVASLAFVGFSINFAASESTGAASSDLVLGVFTATPVYFLGGLHCINSAQGLIDHFQQASSIGKRNLQHDQEFKKRYYSIKRRSVLFQESGRVLLSAKHLSFPRSRKFQLKFPGPFTIRRKLSYISSTLDLLAIFLAHPTLHASHLRKYTPPKFSIFSILAILFLVGDQQYVAKTIVRHMIKN